MKLVNKIFNAMFGFLCGLIAAPFVPFIAAVKFWKKGGEE